MWICLLLYIISSLTVKLPPPLSLSSAGAAAQVPDFIGELLLVATSATPLPVKNPDEDQQDEDEEQGADHCADYHRRSVWS